MMKALTKLRREPALHVAFGGAVTPGSRQFAITRVSGADTTVLNGLVIRAGNGLGGRVLADARIATVTDYLSNSHITHQYDTAVSAERLRSIVGAPVIVEGAVRAVLYGALRTSTQFGSAVLDSIRDAARGVAFDIAVNEATDRRMRTLETSALMRSARETPTAPEWEEVRLAHAELRELAHQIDDEDLRTRIDTIVERLSGRPAADPAVQLSARETDVLALVAVGCTNLEIAERLGLERETVKGYLRNTMRKLDAHRRTEAVTRARTLGLLP